MYLQTEIVSWSLELYRTFNEAVNAIKACHPYTYQKFILSASRPLHEGSFDSPSWFWCLILTWNPREWQRRRSWVVNAKQGAKSETSTIFRRIRFPRIRPFNYSDTYQIRSVQAPAASSPLPRLTKPTNRLSHDRTSLRPQLRKTQIAAVTTEATSLVRYLLATREYQFFHFYRCALETSSAPES